MSSQDRLRFGVGLAVLGALLSLVICEAGCRDPYLAGYRTIATTRATAATVEQSLADVCDLKRRACLEQHGPQTEGYSACIASCRAALEAWTRYTRPAINTALVAAVGSVATAEAVKARVDTLGILRPIACALGRGAKQWIHMLPVSVRATVDAAAALVSGFACPEVK